MTKLPDKSQINYGKEMHDIGYARGYQQHVRDMNKLKSKRERSIWQKFCQYADWLEDNFARNRKR